jgi:hypothetical protein
LRPFRLQAGNYRALIRDCGHAQSECIRSTSGAFFGGRHGLGKCSRGDHADQKADDGNSDQPIANFIHGALLHLVRSRGTPATYGHVGDALSWDGNKICDCHHALGDSVFTQKPDDTQAASQTVIVDQLEC